MLDARRVGLYAAPVSLTLLLLRYFWRQSQLHHPPSPLSLPFVGNLFSIPTGHGHVAFAELGEQLESDIVFLEVLGKKLLILNSAEATSEVLDKRSAIYSDRPVVPMVAEPTLMDWSDGITTMEYGDIWRHYRRMMNNWLNARAVTQFHELQERQAQLLLRRLLSATDDSHPFERVKNEILFAMGSLMLELAYGYKPQDSRDQFYQDAKVVVGNIGEAAVQTNFLVNVFPVLTKVPDWFPGTGWKRIGREWGIQQNRAKTEPYKWLKTQIANGTNQSSLLSSLLQNHKLLSGLSSEERDKRLKEVGISVFGGGTDTTTLYLVNLVFALVSNPHVQAKAQQELDTVLGHMVLPKISDRERLPYIRNLIEEVFRLYPVLPIALPHTCFQDNVYRGYNIQKGTTILGNVWAIGRDSRHYPDPEVFNPDRFLDPQVARVPVFGWGRRKCPGVHFAEGSTFLMTASLLAVFTFSKKRDDAGQEIMPRLELERNSFMFELNPFDFEFKPRSEEHREAILGAHVDE